ncbi:MAG: BamA/TamA family outer membrane protein [Fibrobacteria bacterium]|nr:BamA/TamA family outer membrane protein [Fibrobacteria bacterium]
MKNSIPFSPPTIAIMLLSINLTTTAVKGGDHVLREEDSIVISKIRFIGLKTTEPSVVHRELIHKKGSVYNKGTWVIEKKRLERQDIFASVRLELAQKKNQVELRYQFEELPAVIPFIGGKKTDQDGIIIGPALATLNFLGRDIRLESYGRSSIKGPGKAMEFQAVASALWLGGLPIEYWLQYVYTNSYNSFESFPEKSHMALLELNQRIGSFWNIKYKAEFFSIATEPDNRDILLTKNSTQDNIPRFGFGLVRDTRESRINPHRGLYSEIMYTHSGGFAGSHANFGEWLADFRSFIPLRQKHILHLSFLGQYRTGRIGAYDRFHVSGANTLRAYNPITDGFSGTSEILSFAEYRYEVINKKTIRLLNLTGFYGLQLVAGTDLAYVWDRNNFQEGIHGASYYLGAHILLPGLDRIRLELGNKALSAKLDMGFTLGLFERTAVQRWRIR